MNAEEILKEAGIRATEVRSLVLSYLYEAGCPVSHREISEDPSVMIFDRVTVYRTLNRLEENGLVHKVLGNDGLWRFCAHLPIYSDRPGNHPHFLCVECGSMECLLDQSLPHVDVPEGVRVDGKQLVIYGLCKKCAKVEENK